MAISNRTDFTILEETDDYIVVDKPAPLLVHPSKPSPVPTLWDELRNLLAFDLVNGSALSIINRLDRETSGVVLVTKHAIAARRFSIAMQERKTEKRYQALIHGWPEEDAFTIDAPLLRKGTVEASPIWLKRMVHPDGQASITHVQVLERRIISEQRRFSLVDVRPVTGRMHQIRVHLSHVGHPIVGDKIYNDETCYLRFIEDGWTPELEETLFLRRHALHASSLTFHFLEGDLTWEAPFPKDLDWLEI
ncbi:MAG: 23S rRNA pseudouridine1911/1915/1917 synthase [Verrucomicrobiales bacterium]|jgi:23S rRNA pseudouridine1911/1915/1917 synthase